MQDPALAYWAMSPIRMLRQWLKGYQAPANLCWQPRCNPTCKKPEVLCAHQAYQYLLPLRPNCLRTESLQNYLPPELQHPHRHHDKEPPLRHSLEAHLGALACKLGLRGSLRPTTSQVFEIGSSFCSFFGGCTLSPISVVFPWGVFYMVMSFIEISEDSIFSFSPVFLWIFLTRGSVRIIGIQWW